MATVIRSGRFWQFWNASDYPAEIPLRVKNFVWISTGMFSVAALALAFLGYFGIGNVEGAATHFVASIVSGGLHGAVSTMKFGPADL